ASRVSRTRAAATFDVRLTNSLMDDLSVVHFSTPRCLCPAGTPENGPAIYRWVNLAQNPPSPEGAKENVRKQNPILPSLTGLVPCWHRDPALKRWAILMRPSGTLMLHIRSHP